MDLLLKKLEKLTKKSIRVEQFFMSDKYNRNIAQLTWRRSSLSTVDSCIIIDIISNYVIANYLFL